MKELLTGTHCKKPGRALASVTSTRYLGVLIDQDLTWKLHVANVLKQIRSKLYALYRLRPSPAHLLFRLYQAFVLPVFDYRESCLGTHYGITFKATGTFTAINRH